MALENTINNFPDGLIADLKTRVRLVLDAEGIEVDRNGKILCPWHDEHTPSCHIYGDHVHCHACKAHGDALGLYSRIHGTAFPETVRAVADLAGRSLPTSTTARSSRPANGNGRKPAAPAVALLPPGAEPPADLVGSIYNGSAVVAAYTYRHLNGEPIATHARIDGDGNKSMPWSVNGHWSGKKEQLRLSGLPFYLTERIPAYDPDGLLVYCEGEKATEAAASFAQAIGGCGTSFDPPEECFRWLDGWRGIVLCFADNDAGGLKHAETMASRFRARGLRSVVYQATHLEPSGDVVEWLAERSEAAEPVDLLAELEGIAKGLYGELRDLAEPLAISTPERGADQVLDAAASYSPFGIEPEEEPEPTVPEREPGTEDFAPADQPIFRTLADILRNPHAQDPPEPIVPRMAWRGRVSMLAAAEKLGKSTLVSAGAAAVTTGAYFLEGSASEGSVVHLAIEEHENDYAPRYVRFGADPSRLILADHFPEPAKVLELLEEQLREHRPVLVIIDSLSELAHLVGITDRGKSENWVALMSALRRLARRYGCAILLLHHTVRAGDKYRDSGQIGAGVDVILTMTRDDHGTTRRNFTALGRLAVEDFAVTFDGRSYALAEGTELTLNERVLQAVERFRGCNLTQLRKAVAARGAAVEIAVEDLLAQEVIREEEGPRGARRFFPAGEA